MIPPYSYPSSALSMFRPRAEPLKPVQAYDTPTNSYLTMFSRWMSCNVCSYCMFVCCVCNVRTSRGQDRSNSKRVLRALMMRFVSELCQATSVSDSSITLAPAVEFRTTDFVLAGVVVWWVFALHEGRDECMNGKRLVCGRKSCRRH